jgi:hypothetical protein
MLVASPPLLVIGGLPNPTRRTGPSRGLEQGGGQLQVTDSGDLKSRSRHDGNTLLGNDIAGSGSRFPKSAALGWVHCQVAGSKPDFPPPSSTTDDN